MKIHSLSLHSFSNISSANIPYYYISSSLYSSPNPNRFIKFRTSHRENIRYLKTLGLIPRKQPQPADAAATIEAVRFLKSRGFADADFPRLAVLAPDLFSPTIGATADSHRGAAVDAVLSFLADEVAASPEASRSMILRCPGLLFSDVEYCLRPTLEFLRGIGVERLDAHVLNTRVDKLVRKMRFLRSIGLSSEEAGRVCGRVPAIFGYSIENNLRPKYEFLVWEMGRSLEELKRFPQYFGFSLEKRIEPRYLHLKKRNVDHYVPLNRMLQWSDQKFYARWK